MERQRPDPDALLRSLQKEEERKKQGKLKVFLGMCAGVGKTYAMLSAAHEQVGRGLNLLVGYVETHGRAETDALLEGLNVLPFRYFKHKGVQIKEFDLETALKKRPNLILVDELAHTNAPGSRHTKRWQDVEELLNSGIDVHTTVNVQHIESLVDVVSQVTGTAIRETVPDAFIERADEIELVDIPPQELQQRLREGKVYQAERVDQALGGFFRTGNLIALRELALRRTADRVDAQMQHYRDEAGVHKLWGTRERVVACVAPNKLATKVVRAAARLAGSLHAEQIAAFVASDRQANLSEANRLMAEEAMNLAESLGMEVVRAVGHDIVGEILRISTERNATMVIVGKPVKPRWREILFGSVVDELIRRSGELNVQVITGEGEEATPPSRLASRDKVSVRSIVTTIVVTGLATVVSAAMFRYALDRANLVMMYLLTTAFIASRYGRTEAALAALLSVASFDFFFVPPRFTFSVSDSEYLFTFAVMLGVALLISSLSLQMRYQAQAASEREARASALYSLSRQLAESRKKEELAIATVRKLHDTFGVDAAIFMKREHTGSLIPVAKSMSHFEKQGNELAVAEWAYSRQQKAGLGTTTLAGAQALYVPLSSPRGSVGVLAIKPTDRHPLDSSLLNLVETIATGLALAVERTLLAKEMQDARVEAEAEQLRSALLSTVSHDLRTPLTSISGVASLLEQDPDMPKDKRQEMARTIREESERLGRLVRNLLDMSRLEAEAVEMNLEWQSVEELVGSAINRVESLLGGRKLEVQIEPDLPLVKIDSVLLEQALVNVLENACRHTPPTSPVNVSAMRLTPNKVGIVVTDEGPGIPPGDEARIFEKFYRKGEASGGSGLGLAIARGILNAHGGSVRAANRPSGGASFTIELPVPATQPEAPHG